MKLSKKWLFLVIPLSLFCLGYFAYRHYAIHNIFDEIYYNQEYSLGKPALEKIEGVSNPASGRTNGDSLTHVQYDEGQLPDSVTSLAYTFGYAAGYFAFEIKCDVGNGSSRTLHINYEYDVKNETLHRELWVFNNATPDNNKEYVKKFLEEHGSSIDKCITFGDNVVRTVLLRDWCSVYNSHYSPNDWGDVTVKSKWSAN